MPSAEIIDLFPKPKKELFCSFCKKTESEVKRMFSNSVEGNLLRCICNECIVLAKEKLQENK